MGIHPNQGVYQITQSGPCSRRWSKFFQQKQSNIALTMAHDAAYSDQEAESSPDYFRSFRSRPKVSFPINVNHTVISPIE